MHVSHQPVSTVLEANVGKWLPECSVYLYLMAEEEFLYIHITTNSLWSLMKSVRDKKCAQ